MPIFSQPNNSLVKQYQPNQSTNNGIMQNYGGQSVSANSGQYGSSNGQYGGQPNSGQNVSQNGSNNNQQSNNVMPINKYTPSAMNQPTPMTPIQGSSPTPQRSPEPMTPIQTAPSIPHGPLTPPTTPLTPVSTGGPQQPGESQQDFVTRIANYNQSQPGFSYTAGSGGNAGFLARGGAPTSLIDPNAGSQQYQNAPTDPATMDMLQRLYAQQAQNYR